MRTWLVLGAIGTMMLAGASVQAQSLGFGVDPTKIQNKPISIPDHVQRPIAQPQQLQSAGFSLQKYLPKFSVPSFTAVRGTSTFPTPDKMPGKNYLSSFRWQYAKPVE